MTSMFAIRSILSGVSVHYSEATVVDVSTDFVKCMHSIHDRVMKEMAVSEIPRVVVMPELTGHVPTNRIVARFEVPMPDLHKSDLYWYSSMDEVQSFVSRLYHGTTSKDARIWDERTQRNNFIIANYAAPLLTDKLANRNLVCICIQYAMSSGMMFRDVAGHQNDEEKTKIPSSEWISINSVSLFIQLQDKIRLTMLFRRFDGLYVMIVHHPMIVSLVGWRDYFASKHRNVITSMLNEPQNGVILYKLPDEYAIDDQYPFPVHGSITEELFEPVDGIVEAYSIVRLGRWRIKLSKRQATVQTLESVGVHF